MPGDLENLRSANRSSFFSKPWYVGDRDGRARSSRRSGAARRAALRARRGPAGDRRRARRQRRACTETSPARGSNASSRRACSHPASSAAPAAPAPAPAAPRRPTRSSPSLDAIEFPARRYESLLGLFVDALPAGRASSLHAVGVAFGEELAAAAGLEPSKTPQRAFEQCAARFAGSATRRSLESADETAAVIATPTCPLRPLVRARPEPPRSTAACGRGSPRNALGGRRGRARRVRDARLPRRPRLVPAC